MADEIPSAMKAATWTTSTGGLEKNLKVTSEVSLPPKAKSLPAKSALVKVAYTTLNPADYKLPEIPIVSSLLFSKPAIPCADLSGTVVSTTLPQVKPGQRVFGISPPPAFRALAEYVLVTGEDNIVTLPDSLNLHEASTVGVCGGTAYQSIVPYVRPGSKVFINGGSGGVGTFGIQIAKATGCIVTATCSSANVEFCKSLGADEVIDYRSTDVVEHLKRKGTQYDLLLDYVGTPAIYWGAEHYLKPEGVYITIAGNVSFYDVWVMINMFLLPSWLGGGKRKAKFLALAPKAADYEQIAKWMEEGKVKAVIEKTYGMEQAAEAFAKLKLGRTRGKLVVKVAGG